jgi:hypothetical protein
MTTIFVNTEVEVEVDLDEISDDELLSELKSRGFMTMPGQIQKLYEAYVLNQHSVVDQLLKDLFYETLGRIA